MSNTGKVTDDAVNAADEVIEQFQNIVNDYQQIISQTNNNTYTNANTITNETYPPPQPKAQSNVDEKEDETSDAVDVGGFAPAKHYCSHISALVIPKDINAFPKIDEFPECVEAKCDKKENWVCLKCHKVFCGRYGNKHMVQHYNATNKKHCIAMGVGDLSFWCYKCDDYLHHLSIEKVFQLYKIVHQIKFKAPIPKDLEKETDFMDCQSIDSSEDEQQEIDRYYMEPLYAGNLSMKSNGMHGNPYFYRWILFVSASNTEIKSPQTVKSVEYKFKNGSKIIDEPPFFLESGSNGIFQLTVIISFKNDYMRSMLELPYILSIETPTTLVDVTHSTPRECIDTLFDYKKFKCYKYEQWQSDNGSKTETSFVSHIGSRLNMALKRTPKPLRLVGFCMRLEQCKDMLHSVIQCIPHLCKLNIPSSIHEMIAIFTVFHSLYPITNLVQNQRCVITECNNCDIKIAAPKFNHLLIKSCDNLSIEFPHILSQCELHKCNNITLICSNVLYSYRFDECKNVKIIFNDALQRTTFLCFESLEIVLTVQNIKYFRSVICDEEQTVDKTLYSDTEKYPKSKTYDIYKDQNVNDSRLNVRWRSTVDNPMFSTRKFHPNQTIGSNRF